MEKCAAQVVAALKQNYGLQTGAGALAYRFVGGDLTIVCHPDGMPRIPVGKSIWRKVGNCSPACLSLPERNTNSSEKCSAQAIE